MSHLYRRGLSVCALALCVILSACSQSTSNRENSLSVQALPSTAGALDWQAELRVQKIEYVAANEGYRAIGQGLHPIAQPGEPDLVGAKALFAIPVGWDVKVTVEDSAAPSTQNIEIAPYETVYRCQADAPSTERAPCYRSAAPFPESIYSLEQFPGEDGHTLTQLSIHPLQYRPLEKMLQTHSFLRLRIHAESRQRSSSALPRPSWLSSLAVVPERSPAPIKVPSTLLVIAEDNYLTDSVFLKWLEWKTKAGFAVKTQKVSELGRTTAYIQAAVRAQSPDFLLLIGDQAMVPPFYELAGWQIAATDYPYARTSDLNPFPTRFVGRITASNTAQLHTQLQRSLDADQGKETDQWVAHATTIASSEGYSPSDVQYAQAIESNLASQGFDIVDRFYEGAKTAYSQMIRDALSEGRGWVSYFGHGSGTAWSSTNGAFTTADVNKITNKGKLPMVVDVACDNGAWTRLEPSFSESWMNLEVDGEPAGSVGYFGGSIKVSWHEPAVMSVGVSDYRFRRKAALMGPAVFAGQVYMLEKLGVNKTTLGNLSAYNLFGDPSLLVRTKALSDYSLTTRIETDASGKHLVIEAARPNGSPVEGLYLGLSSANEALGRWEIVHENTVRWDIPSQLTTPLTLTAYGNGWNTKELTQNL